MRLNSTHPPGPPHAPPPPRPRAPMQPRIEPAEHAAARLVAARNSGIPCANCVLMRTWVSRYARQLQNKFVTLTSECAVTKTQRAPGTCWAGRGRGVIISLQPTVADVSPPSVALNSRQRPTAERSCRERGRVCSHPAHHTPPQLPAGGATRRDERAPELSQAMLLAIADHLLAARHQTHLAAH
jgi:hypothetical protein